MSTTTDLQVAVRYGLGPRSLLFVLTCDNFMQYGAELQWLSAFPGEAEAQATLSHLYDIPLGPGACISCTHS